MSTGLDGSPDGSVGAGADGFDSSAFSLDFLAFLCFGSLDYRLNWIPLFGEQ